MTFKYDPKPIMKKWPTQGPSNLPKKPKKLTGEVSKAWDYLVNCKGVCRTEQFDDDFAPVGPSLRFQLAQFGVQSSTSGKSTIIYLPE